MLRESLEGTAKIKNAILKKDPKGNYEFKLKTININGVKKGCSGFIKKGNTIVYLTTESTDTGLGYMYRYAKDFKDYRGHHNQWSKTFEGFIDDLINALNGKSPFNESYHPFDSEHKVEDRNYKGVEYTVLPDGEYCDIRIYAPKGKSFNNGDTWYSTTARLSDADNLVKKIIDGEAKRNGWFINESFSLSYIKKLNEDIIKLIEGEVIDFTSYRDKKNNNVTNPNKEEPIEEPKEELGKDLPAKDYTKNPADVEVGDILVCEWGWSMRLVDYYRVISRTKSSVKLEHLKGRRITDDGWTGTEVPTDIVEKDDKVDGKLFRIGFKYNKDVVCRIDGHLSCEFWDGKPKHFDTLD